MTVRGTVIFIRKLEIEIVGRRFSLYVGRPRRLEIGTAGRQFSLYSKVQWTANFIRRLEIGTALGSFLYIQLLKDDSCWN